MSGGAGRPVRNKMTFQALHSRAWSCLRGSASSQPERRLVYYPSARRGKIQH